MITPASGQFLSDRTGLLYKFDVESGGHIFEVETVSNFNIEDHTFDNTQKRLTLHVFSGLENNIGEIILSNDIMGENFTIFINDQQSHQDIKSNDKISFITLNFTGSGNNQIDIIGNSSTDSAPGGGCLIATAAYGTELASQVQLLREIRDEKIMNTSTGVIFMESFNQLYYLFSPQIADYQRENHIFREIVKITITPLVTSLGIMSLADSEYEILTYGSMVILFNVGMYVLAPIFFVRLIIR